MKAIILAAGSGTRLKKYTQELPKGMLEIFGKPLIQHQIESYRRNGINDITIVTGFCADKINFPGTRKIHNPHFASTNMVESLFCASEYIEGELIISYADILFEDHVLKAAIRHAGNIGVVVDTDWKDYWYARYGKVDFDTESLSINEHGSIHELGTENPHLDTIDGRYVGLIRLSPLGADYFRRVYSKGKEKFSGEVWLNGRTFEKIYMTDFLQKIINNNQEVLPIRIERGWLEFDTNEDYENIINMDKTGQLSQFYKRLT